MHSTLKGISGTSEGAILVYSVSDRGDKVELTRQLEGHSVPISDISTDISGQHLVSTDEHGTIILWQDITSSTEPAIVISDSRYFSL